MIDRTKLIQVVACLRRERAGRDNSYWEGFAEGAQWADTNPLYTREDLAIAFEAGKKEANGE